MAQALNKTKRRIKSVKNTKKVTEAMELVATVKLRTSKSLMEKNMFYSEEIKKLISTLFNALEDENIYLKEGKGKKNLIIVINSNYGLCASFNSNVFNLVKKTFSNEENVILSIGLKGLNFYKKEGYEVIKDYVFLNEKNDYEDCVKFSRYILNLFNKGEYKSIKLIYTKYVNSLNFVPSMINLFPIEKLDKKSQIGYGPIFDPDINSLIDELVPIYLTSTIYQSLIESEVSEQASRRTAMENANDNADEIIEKLTIEYNKARQSAITQEINEIVGGLLE